MISAAVISPDGRYRYRLMRRWGEGADYRWVLWIMLNPSTADAFVDDRTIGRCIAFSKLWGFSAMAVVNLYAIRSTDPAAIRLPDARGPDNSEHLRSAILSAETVVCAWGAHGPSEPPAPFNHGVTLHCLGLTKSGAPKHPLYLPANTPLVEWRR